jgi:hypothetical protein
MIVRKRRPTAISNLTTFTYTEPILFVAAAKEIIPPVHRTAVASALNSPKYAIIFLGYFPEAVMYHLIDRTISTH